MERIYEIVITFVLSLILGATGYMLECNFAMTIFSVVAFTCFDILGYFFMVSKLPDFYKKNGLIAYRVMQTVFQLILFFVLFFYAPISGIFYIFLWWFGVCDLLYYLFLREPFQSYDNFFWLWWTPYGIILGKDKIYAKHLVFYSIVSFIVFLVVNIYFNFFVEYDINEIILRFLNLI